MTSALCPPITLLPFTFYGSAFCITGFASFYFTGQSFYFKSQPCETKDKLAYSSENDKNQLDANLSQGREKMIQSSHFVTKFRNSTDPKILK